MLRFAGARPTGVNWPAVCMHPSHLSQQHACRVCAGPFFPLMGYVHVLASPKSPSFFFLKPPVFVLKVEDKEENRLRSSSNLITSTAGTSPVPRSLRLPPLAAACDRYWVVPRRAGGQRAWPGLRRMLRGPPCPAPPCSKRSAAECHSDSKGPSTPRHPALTGQGRATASARSCCDSGSATGKCAGCRVQ
jgi:hypothetical protein